MLSYNMITIYITNLLNVTYCYLLLLKVTYLPPLFKYTVTPDFN